MTRRRFNIIATTIALMASLGCEVGGDDTVEYRSPRGVYTVQLVGRRSAPRLPFLQHTLHARAFSGAKQLVNDWEVHSADWFDSSFADEYEQGSWPAENVFRLKSFAPSADGKTIPEDIIIIANNSGRVIRFLSIKAADLFFVFDVPDGAKLQLPATPQSLVTDLSWIEVGGTWTTDSRIPTTGFNFELPESAKGPFRYVVDVQPTRVQVREIGQGAKVYSGR